MVGDDVHHDPDADGACVPDERVELVEIAVVGLDVEVVGDVVAVIGLRRRVARVEPDRVDAEVGEVRQAAADSGEITDAVVVRVGERPHVQLVDDRRLPPRECAVDRVAPVGGMERADHHRVPVTATCGWSSTPVDGALVVPRTTSSSASSSTNGIGLTPVASAPVRISEPR